MSSSDAFASIRATSCRIAVLAVDPTRRRGGGALLGDRIQDERHRLAADLLPLSGDPGQRLGDSRSGAGRDYGLSRRGL